jgi:hypothetical protein
MLASITSFRRVAPFVSAIRLISMIPPTVAKVESAANSVQVQRSSDE